MAWCAALNCNTKSPSPMCSRFERFASIRPPLPYHLDRRVHYMLPRIIDNWSLPLPLCRRTCCQFVQICFRLCDCSGHEAHTSTAYRHQVSGIVHFPVLLLRSLLFALNCCIDVKCRSRVRNVNFLVFRVAVHCRMC